MSACTESEIRFLADSTPDCGSIQNIVEMRVRKGIIAPKSQEKFMSDPIASPPVGSASEPTKRRGCFFYGCITVLVLMVLFGIAGFFAVRYGLNKFNAFVEQYTETTPMTLPTVQMPPTDYQLLDKRATAFADLVKARKASPPLVLTGEEINALIANNPAWKSMKGRVYVT